MPSIGPLELAIILIIFLIVFGGGKLPEVGGAIGKGIAEFRKNVSEKEETARPIGSERQEGQCLTHNH